MREGLEFRNLGGVWDKLPFLVFILFLNGCQQSVTQPNLVDKDRLRFYVGKKLEIKGDEGFIYEMSTNYREDIWKCIEGIHRNKNKDFVDFKSIKKSEFLCLVEDEIANFEKLDGEALQRLYIERIKLIEAYLTKELQEITRKFAYLNIQISDSFSSEQVIVEHMRNGEYMNFLASIGYNSEMKRVEKILELLHRTKIVLG